MKKLFFSILLLFLIHNLNAQIDAIPYCGTYKKAGLTNGRPLDYYDRFGNEYDKQEVSVSYLLTQGYSVSSCKSGYYKLIFKNGFSDVQKEVFCKVFEELSTLIVPPIAIPDDKKIPILIDIDFNPLNL